LNSHIHVTKAARRTAGNAERAWNGKKLFNWQASRIPPTTRSEKWEMNG